MGRRVARKAAAAAGRGAATGVARLRHLGSGKYSDVFKVGLARGGPSLVMKVSYYRDDTLCDVLKRARKGDVAGAVRAKRRDSIQVSDEFARLTRGLMDVVSPHFVLVHCSFDCKNFAPRLGPLLADRLKGLTTVQRRYNNVCFMETFHDNLTRFLTKGKYDEATLRGLVFQVLYTLAALQRMLPGFRHNDLSTNNVLVKRLAARPLLAYTVPPASGNGGRAGDRAGAAGGTTFYVSVPLLAALSDYDFTHVPDHPSLSNERVMSGKYRVDGRRNDSYDSHFFLKSVLKCIQRRVAEFPDTAAFLDRLRLRPQDRQNGTQIARVRPSRLLEDDYFRGLTAPPPRAPDASYAF